MNRNNFAGLVFHLFIALVVFIILAIINLSENLVRIVYGNILFKAILVLIPIILYYNLGKLLSKKGSSGQDFFSGTLIYFCIIGFLIIGFITLNTGIFKVGVGESIGRLPLDIFFIPELLIIKILKLPYNFITVLIFGLLPGIIYGFATRRGRIKLRREQLEKRRQSRRPR